MKHRGIIYSHSIYLNAFIIQGGIPGITLTFRGEWIVYAGVGIAIIGGAAYAGFCRSQAEAQMTVNAPPTITVTRGDGIYSVTEPGRAMDPNLQNLPPVEVVVSKDTKILKSVGTETITDSNGNQVVKKKEEEVTINELGTNDIVNVWGEKRGDRYYADVITYIEM